MTDLSQDGRDILESAIEFWWEHGGTNCLPWPSVEHNERLLAEQRKRLVDGVNEVTDWLGFDRIDTES